MDKSEGSNGNYSKSSLHRKKGCGTGFCPRNDFQKYDLHMTIERFVSDDNIPEQDKGFTSTSSCKQAKM